MKITVGLKALDKMRNSRNTSVLISLPINSQIQIYKKGQFYRLKKSVLFTVLKSKKKAQHIMLGFLIYG